MRIWTYVRPFQYADEHYEVKFFCSLLTYTSQLFCNGTLIDERTQSFTSELKVIEHIFQPTNQVIQVAVSVGYYNWWSVGIEVRARDELIYASHPGKDIHFAHNKLTRVNTSNHASDDLNKSQSQSAKWQQNKYSILADIGLGGAFFIVAKMTGDLTLAAFTGVILGLALVILQRFVKVYLLGGLAVYGTIMLLISAVFSLVFQSEYLVQLKGTILGLVSAAVLLTDGLWRKGRYFGPRFERYLSSPIEHQYFAVGLGVIGIGMAGVNYLVANQLTPEQWLIYSTFVDTPLYLILLIILIARAEKKYSNSSTAQVR